MRYLNKAIWLAWRDFKWSIIISVLSSLMVGVLWGANVGAVYPFAEVIFKGDNLHQWIARETEACETGIREGEAKIAAMKAENASSGEIYSQEQAVEGWRNRLKSVEKTRPWIEKYAPTSPFNTLLGIVAFLLIGTALKCFFLAISTILMARAAFRTSRSLQRQFFAKMLDLQLGKSRRDDTGDSATRVGGDINAIGNAISILLGKSLREPAKMIACIALAAYINWRLLLLSLLVCPLAAYLLMTLAKSIKRTSVRVMEANGRVIGFFLQINNGFQVVKAFGNEELENKRFFEKTEAVFRQQMKLEIYGSLIRSNNELLGIGMVCLSLVAGGYLVLNQATHIFGIKLADKAMDFGGIMTFYAALIAAADPIRKLGDVFGSIQAGTAGAERVFSVLAAEPAIKDPENPVPLQDGDICFKDVSFRYNQNVSVLNDMNLTIRRGEKVAIVGPNGCGKSTLINLMLRFYDPDEGAVTIGGIDIRDATQKDLRSRIGLVNQNTVLFNDSIQENIRYGRLSATDEEVAAAGKLAEVDTFVHTHTSHGYKSNCGELGSSLSGGQRQRIAIARALLKNPDIFIFDEATSQIDLESERQIHAAFERCVGDSTAILITHRPAALELADRIIVMNAGQVEAIGSHEELLKRSQTYYELYREEVVQDRQAA
ncbi:ABC transporter ATP-binding protein/permease [Blastopirellula sp. JC732]|uniref:ABC transporter ATP-binding protein/permease n=1 Tax=Blastopirellula sediminis TaxID=2894196 RepID=A0A9X1MJT6_9BACT|nr:ABC transporter ATP-binding protein [Blastopirellula sediminis]MCC9609592.1 ABC transporter ATP-binding protein/permease [Blastopirellula sediminis]MCC9627632.1 ABC transporter ATP-binding protein/permease [Blastopirellula sediminis]